MGSQLLSRDLAAVLAARIDALPTEPRSVLRDAAVVGDTVPTGVIEALRERRAPTDARPGAVAAVELERAVDELLQRRMLHRVRGGYAFSTPLMREAAYAGLGKADLADRHAYLARWAAPETVTALGYDGAGRLSLGENERDAFVATHAECAVELADAVRLRPDAAARDVIPLGVAALGRMARRALAKIEPAASIQYAERAATIARDGLPLSDQLVHARALLRLGRASEALAYGEKIAASADEEPVCRAEALLVVGRAEEALGDTSRAIAAWQQALDVATAAELAPERANAMRRLGMADFLARQAEPGEQPVRGGLPGDARGGRPARSGLGAAEPGLGDHDPGRLRGHGRRSRPRRPALRRAGRPGRAVLAARHDRLRAAAGRPAARVAAAGPDLPALRRPRRRGLGGGHAAGRRGVRGRRAGRPVRGGRRGAPGVPGLRGRLRRLGPRARARRARRDRPGPRRARARRGPAHRRARVRRPHRAPAAAGHG
nr:hypothetical protein GCM10020092_005770 [Actinoplanes digitatis]